MIPISRTLCALPLAGALLLGTPQEAAATPKRELAQRTAPATQLPALHPTLARGARPEARYDTDDAAAVDLFNGQLSLSLPLGQVYRLDSQLSLALTLRYSSQVWDFATVNGASEGSPRVHSNAGLGFDLSLGRLVPPASAANPTSKWLYVSPDGGQHLFYSDLHHDTPDAGDSGDITQYTRDGSYLRLRHLSANTKLVEQGDGVVREFTLSANQWRLARLASQAGNGVTLTSASDELSWTLADNFGRVWTVYFEISVDPAGTKWRLVDRVEVPAFGGQQATYDLAYSFAAVGRACVDSRGGATTVPLLTTVTDPVGRTQAFEYTANGADCHDNARLKRTQLVSGGHYDFDYGAYAHPPASCTAPTPAHFLLGSGVVRRRKLQPDGTVVGTWTYTPQVDAAAGGGCGFDGRRTVVSTPLGDQHVYHFAVGTDAASAGGPGLYGLPIAPTRPHASGQLHLAEEIFDCEPGGSVCTLMRSRWARWDQDQICTSTGGGCFDTNPRLGRIQEIFEDDTPLGGVKRFRDVTFSGFDGLGSYRSRVETSNFGKADLFTTVRVTNAEAGTYPPGQLNEGGTPGFYAVPAASQPWFLEDYAYAVAIDENGASVRTDACFAAEGWLLRTRRRADAAALSANDVVTAFEWSGGEAVEEARMGGDLVPLGTTGSLCALILPADRFATVREYEHGALARETVEDELGQPLPYLTLDRDLDPNTGKTAVTREANGLVTTLVYDLAGRPTWQRPEEGAWTQWVYSLPTGASTWNAGPKTIRYERPNGGGTPLRTRTLLHDTFNRLSGDWISMPAGALSGTRYQYNALDWKTSESTPYAPGTGGTIFWTQFLNHDPLGRARIVRPPEGAVHDEVFTYLGDRETRVARKAGSLYTLVGSTPTCFEEAVIHTKLFDGLGRVWLERSEENAPAPGRTLETEREHAADGQLRELTRRETVGETTQSTITEFVHDGRGFALSSGSRNGAGRLLTATERQLFDARGRHHQEVLGGDLHPGAGITISLSYDALGRVVEIRDAGGSQRLWKELIYATENGVADGQGRIDRRTGKLVAAIRHSYFEQTHYQVTSGYTYRGLEGQVSETLLDIDTVSSASAELQMDKTYRTMASYDELGQLGQLQYPGCLVCSSGEPTAPPVLTYYRDQGYLTGLAATRGGQSEPWLNSMSWSLSRMPFEVVHANGVKDIYQPDPFRRPRSSSIVVRGPSGDLRYDSGAFTYDGTGQTCGIGADSSVRPPLEVPADSLAAPACASAQEIDPFGRWNGRITDEACRGTMLESVNLYDAFEQPVARLSRGAVKELTVNGVPYWVADPANFEKVWWVRGIDGRILSEVHDHATSGWRSSMEMIYAQEGAVGKAKREWTAPSFVRIVHYHPMTVFSTQPNGRPWPAEN